jgi:hypothetical protein
MPKNADNAEQDANLARDALLMFPADTERLREEFIDVPQRLAEDAGAAVQQRTAHDKRLKKVFGAEGKALTFVRALLRMSPGLAARTFAQAEYLADKLGVAAQLELPLAQPGTVTPDNGAVFDTTAAGERQATERRDDPGQVTPRVPRVDEPAPASAKGTAVMPLAEFRAQLEANNAKAEEHIKRRGKKPGLKPLDGADGQGSYTIVG